jgi:hypothetical protein
MITASRYRVLLLASVAVSILGGVLSVTLRSSLPSELQTYLVKVEEAPMTTLGGVGSLLGLALLLVGTVAVTLGLCRFRPWSRPAALLLTVFVLPLELLSGPTVDPPAAQALYELGSIMWGAVLAAAYWSPLAERFKTPSIAA